jgi:hypothetical protein
MKRLSTILLIALLLPLSGCVTWEHTWDIGHCTELKAKTSGCNIRIPKSGAGVDLFVEWSVGSDDEAAQLTPLSLRIRNEETHTIQIQGLREFLDVTPGKSVTLPLKPFPKKSGRIPVCGFDTHEGPIRLNVQVAEGKLNGIMLRFIAHSSDAL